MCNLSVASTDVYPFFLVFQFPDSRDLNSTADIFIHLTIPPLPPAPLVPPFKPAPHILRVDGARSYVHVWLKRPSTLLLSTVCSRFVSTRTTLSKFPRAIGKLAANFSRPNGFQRAQIFTAPREFSCIVARSRSKHLVESVFECRELGIGIPTLPCSSGPCTLASLLKNN